MIHVAIGSEPDQRIPALVLEHSIRTRASQPVVILWSWDPHTRAWRDDAVAHERLGGTNFSSWRWIAPGYSRTLAEPPEVLIYLDCDQVVLVDIADLEALLPQNKAYAFVVGAEGEFGGKATDPGARETSVMVLRPAAFHWTFDELARMVETETMLVYARASNPGAREAKSDYAALMQGTWLPNALVHELPKGWMRILYDMMMLF